MPFMRSLRLRRDFDGSELIDFEPSRDADIEGMSKCYLKNILAVIESNEEKLVEWQAYLLTDEQEDNVSVFEHAHFILTDKRLLISLFRNGKAATQKFNMSELMSYGTANAECFALPEIEIRFDSESVCFLIRRDEAPILERRIFNELRRRVYHNV